MLFTVPEHFIYIPLSSLIILLVILITCASRRKKNDPFSSVEQNLESDIKEEYAVLCFPCLKKRPELKNLEPMEDLTNQFEYILEKYTIRKVPLVYANTVEDIIERKEELELAKVPENQPQLFKDDFANFQIPQDVYNVQRIPPCITMASSVTCPGKKALKERPIPSDILESMSPVIRPAANNNNYVVIPTRGSLRHKDIMLTKREITNQYLNNFSSVFVDNLKDQVPKDPEQYPSLSRPYTSSYKTFPIDDSKMAKTKTVKGKKGKGQKVAYTFSVADSELTAANFIKEEGYTDSDSIREPSTDPPDSEFQDEGTLDESTDKSKSLFMLNDSDSIMAESIPNPFKTTIRESSMSEAERNLDEVRELTAIEQKDEWGVPKNVTYEDIQALDVGYEFTSCEKLGVKPKMTRIPCTMEPEKFKESFKLIFRDPNRGNKKSQHPNSVSSMRSLRTVVIKPPNEKQGSQNFNDVHSHSEKNSLKSVVTETSFLTNAETTSQIGIDSGCSETKLDEKSTKTEGPGTESDTVMDSVTEISKLYDLAMPLTILKENATTEVGNPNPINEVVLHCPKPSKSRSFQDTQGSKKDDGPEGKGKDQNQYSAKKELIKLDEPETETTCSLYSHDSKTSSVLTTGPSSEVDEEKRATLRWKIVIKHHREDDKKKSTSVNLRH